MKKSILTSIIVISSLNLLAQSEDSGLIYYFKHNPGSLVVLIGFAAFYFIIKPIYNSIKGNISSNKVKPMVQLTVAEVPFIVYKHPEEPSEILAELAIGDKFFADPNFNNKSYNKVILSSGLIGYFKKIEFQNLSNT